MALVWSYVTFNSLKATVLAVRLTHLSTQKVPGVSFPSGQSTCDVKVAGHFISVPKLMVSGAVSQLPHTPS